MKNKKTANMLLFAAILIICSCSKANAQDNNVIKIGNQIWMSRNLNVSTYRNGDSIPPMQDINEWENLKTGAWCYYENKTENGTTYGKLYNWYAVNDPRGLAPKGYHIPSDAEWKTLTDYLGGEKVAGKKMKSTSFSMNQYIGTNSSGFNGLPGGYRDDEGKFTGLNQFAFWWSTTAKSDSLHWDFDLCLYIDFVNKSYYRENFGFSVRCIRDK